MFDAGFEAVLGIAVETTTTLDSYNYTTTLPDIPSSPSIIGYANVPQVTANRASKKGFGIGSPYAVYNGKGTRRYETNIDVAVANAQILNWFLRGSTGFKGLPDLALFTGTSDLNDVGFTRVHRMAKCNNFTLNLQEGEAQEIRLQGQMMGLHEQDDDLGVLEPSEADLTSAGAVYFWHNTITTNVGSTQLRDVIAGLNIQVNHNVKPRGYRAGADDDNPLHLCHYALTPGQFQGRATITLHERLDSALRNATSNATVWGNITTLMQYPDKDVLVTLYDCLLANDSQQGGDSGDGPMQYSVDVLFKKMTAVAGSGSGGGS